MISVVAPVQYEEPKIAELLDLMLTLKGMSDR